MIGSSNDSRPREFQFFERLSIGGNSPFDRFKAGDKTA